MIPEPGASWSQANYAFLATTVGKVFKGDAKAVEAHLTELVSCQLSIPRPLGCARKPHTTSRLSHSKANPHLDPVSL